jgi:cobalt-zinc-cadmium efflux system protein
MRRHGILNENRDLQYSAQAFMDSDHSHAADSSKQLGKALLVTLGFAAVEGYGGWLSGSLALLGDAGHMLTDSTALALAVLGARIAKRPPSARHSYGMGRAEVIAAVVNVILMLLVVSTIIGTALDRFRSPQAISGGTVIVIAAIGLLVNVVIARILSHGEQTLNSRAALLHVLGDLLGSIAALLAGLVVYFTGWTPIDPILSLFICALILLASIQLLRDALHVIMEGVPSHIDLHEVAEEMSDIPGVLSVHDLHIWAVSARQVALSAHLVLREFDQWPEILDAEQKLLQDRYQIGHATLQPESSPGRPNETGLENNSCKPCEFKQS